MIFKFFCGNKGNGGNMRDMDDEKISDSVLLLTKLQYCHIINNNTGEIRLVEGPYRGSLESHESIYGRVQNKIILKDGQYAIILNPYDKEKEEIKYGDREVRIGPTMFSLHPAEELDTSIQVGQRCVSTLGIWDEYILKQNTGLLVKALKDFEDNTGVLRKAGDLWIVEGPINYIPHKYAQVQKMVEALSLGHFEGVYIKNVRTGEIRLEIGPRNVMLNPDEELYEKNYTSSELEAIKFKEDINRTRAQPLWVLENEATLIMSEEDQTIVFGPKVVMLGPFERPYIMTISGGTPVGEEEIKTWKTKLGPNFCTDELDVRTKDNAVLKITLSYKWKFKVDDQDPAKIFRVSDYIGLATSTMAGIIRDEAAKHDFEELNSQSMIIIKQAIFGAQSSYIFEENGFEIFDIDIQEIVPEDKEIATQLKEAIKSNMEVYVNKIKQTAEIEAQKELIQGNMQIETKKKELIKIQQENLRNEKLEQARIEVEALKIKVNGEVEALKLKASAEADAKINEMVRTIETLQIDGSRAYLQMQHILSFANIGKTLIVPSDSKLILPILDKKLLEGISEEE